jgi:hypothetical protein
MDEQTRSILQAPFRPEQIKQRQGSFGKPLSYVEGNAVIARLNQAFSHAWSFEVLSIDINTDAGEVIAHVRISADGVVKEGYGGSQIKRQRESKEIIDLGNDIKAACTDALKKAATLFGVGLHLYQDTGAAEAGMATPQPEPAPPQRSQSHAGSRAGSHAGATRKHSNQETIQKGTGTVTDKQLNYLRRLAKKQDISEEDLNDYCHRVYAANLDAISKSEASFLIEGLRHGEIPYYDNAA